jgi:hypothetical protein
MKILKNHRLETYLFLILDHPKNNKKDLKVKVVSPTHQLFLVFDHQKTQITYSFKIFNFRFKNHREIE